MRALTVEPLKAGSAEVREVADPEPAAGELLVEGLALGVCGTDREIAAGEYGWPPPGRDRLVLGHESLGRVLSAPPDRGFAAGDLVVGVVRRPDPEPCGACAHGEFDMCRNGRYTECGIKEIDGYGSQRWTVPADYAVGLDARLADVGVLMEPTSVVAKAWDQVAKVGGRSWFEPERVLIAGAGPIGLLAALLGMQRGLEVHVLDVATDGPKPAVVEALGARYHSVGMREAVAALRPDIVIEATGVPGVVFEAMTGNAPYGVVCLTGVSPVGHHISVDIGGANREMVLENDVVVGSVNANLGHYAAAATALADAELGWLSRLITRRVPLEGFADALQARPDDIKVVLELT
ncbi:glucose 1-dehydrogenase [Actinoplanes teichomyceticus]|uniref:Threonine dehydrogenase-like Zn-dependent dehydrogenase n=1 Tax=Actinoplanes teichomyceticus TaxID=1867 RepID=A0A561VL14_ACTTI|nr:glucose 1-dehydrogenase [Actinoplanes teichomyceticus]TWG12309.1 threonine dehydrogenase-like Zn-dependent dehydrogenase [Actinoplanes teichomyceticus]GIF14250.1 threonine dehydrogenase [Actinoplanes teichomyceticus]